MNLALINYISGIVKQGSLEKEQKKDGRIGSMGRLSFRLTINCSVDRESLQHQKNGSTMGKRLGGPTVQLIRNWD
jgi:hypothetical protein